MGAVSTDSKNFYEVVELSVDVADHGYGGLNVDNVTLAHQQFFRLGADSFDDGFGEEFSLVQT
jgi:hypothetical protein